MRDSHRDLDRRPQGSHLFQVDGDGLGEIVYAGPGCVYVLKGSG